MDTKAPWRIMISLKIGTEAGYWFTKEARGSYGVGLWEEIIKEIPHFMLNCSFGVASLERFYHFG